MIVVSLKAFVVAALILAAAFAALLFAPFYKATAVTAPYQDPAPKTADSKPLPQGVSLLPEDPFQQLKVSGGASVTVETEPVSITGQPFKTALQLRTLRRSETPYAVQLSGKAVSGVKKGDVLLATFYVRTIKGQAETGEAHTEFVFERGEAPHTKAVTQGINIPPVAKGWTRIDIPFEAAEDLEPERTNISFRLGYDPQAFEIGGIRLTNYGTRVGVKDLPRTRATYAGMEPDASWRREAEKRIEKHRKGDLTVVVREANGKALPNARVQMRMKRHAFPFGSAVAAEMLLRNDPDAKKYQETVGKLFNRVVMENDLKWSNWEQNPEQAKKGVAWLREQGIEVRGHCLVWPSWRWLPGDLPGLKDNPAALAKRIDTHITQETRAFAGQLVQWDVINEPFVNHDLMDILGKDAMVHWFRLTKANDPTAILFLNDYPPLDGSDKSNAHLNHFFETIQYLKEKGAPIEGIGFQGHFGGSVIPPERLLSGLDRFAKFGLPIAITEFDIDTADETLQADYTRDFTTALFSHPAVDSIVMWGFWEGRHWRPAASMFRNNWSLKLNGHVWQDLVFKTWWTNAEGITGGKGEYKTRGFLGDYEITATGPDGKTKTVNAKLTKGGTRIPVILP